MTPDNITGNADLKVQSLFDSIEDLRSKKKYEEALEIIEENKSFLQQHSDMKYQVLLNKYYADALYHVTLFSYERDSDEMLFEKMFTEHRSYFEVHLDKKSYLRLLKIEGFVKKRKRAKMIRILAPVLIIAVLAGSFLVYKSFDKDKIPVIESGANQEESDNGTIDNSTEKPVNGSTDNSSVPENGATENSSVPGNDSTDNTDVDKSGSNSINPSSNNSSDPSPGSNSSNALDPEGSENILDEESADYLLPSDQRELTRSDIVGMSAKEVRLAINEMYARKGYNFGAGANQRYFDEKSWYVKDVNLDKAEDVAAKFTDIENANLSFLAAEERRLKNN